MGERLYSAYAGTGTSSALEAQVHYRFRGFPGTLSLFYHEHDTPRTKVLEIIFLLRAISG